MDKALLDTDIFSEITKGRNANVQSRSAAYLAQHGRYTISTMTVMEVVFGLHQKHEEARIQAFLVLARQAELLPVDLESAEMAGRILADLKLAGKPIGSYDPLIAAIALRHGLTLVTGNTRHYEHIAALGHPLKLENWRE